MRDENKKQGCEKRSNLNLFSTLIHIFLLHDWLPDWLLLVIGACMPRPAQPQHAPCNFNCLNLYRLKLWHKTHSSAVIRSQFHQSGSLQETHTHTETTTLKAAALVGFMEQLGTRKTFPPLLHLFPLMLSLFPLTVAKQHGQSSPLPIPPSLSLSPPSARRKCRARDRQNETVGVGIWLFAWACVRPNVRVWKSFCASARVCVFENVCASLPLTFCRLGGQENVTRLSKTDYRTVIFSHTYPGLNFYFINNYHQSSDRRSGEEVVSLKK